MAQRDFDAIEGDERLAIIADYIPGYVWILRRFGPPPGIPKERKDELDTMNDKDYLYADRVQCAFCGEILRNWERGDVPKIPHKNFFNYRKIVQNKPCHNIPVNELMKDQLSSSLRTDAKPATLGDLNINTVRPKDPSLSVFSKRKETYQLYPDSNPVSADNICEAGFFYEGIGDTVKCFWCNGALKMWSKGDDPWTEHAKWYPGCTFVQNIKGLEFIRKARSTMTPENINAAESLVYNKGDTTFLKRFKENVEKIKYEGKAGEAEQMDTTENLGMEQLYCPVDVSTQAL